MVLVGVHRSRRRTLPALCGFPPSRLLGPESGTSAIGPKWWLPGPCRRHGRQVRRPLPRRFKPVPTQQLWSVNWRTCSWMPGVAGRGELTSTRQAEWQASVRRLVESQATHSEATTFKNAIRTLQELYRFQILRGRIHGLEGVDPVDLDAFLHGETSAPTRSLQALRWVNKNAQLQWTLPELRRSKQPSAVGK